MKISNLIEQIFAYAVSLDQNGGLKNTIFAIANEIFIMNYDHTVLLRFSLRKSELSFDQTISFKANDYDSNLFEEIDGKIVFYSENEMYSRKKICGKSNISPEQIKELYRLYAHDLSLRETICISKKILELLDDDLSHIEFSGRKGEKLKLIQRNIYSGGIIEIQEKNKQGFFTNSLKADFGPVGIKTNDFKSLFTFEDTLNFHFPCENDDYVIVKSMNESKRNMTGILSCCLYDEIIKIKETNHGRQKQKIRRS